MPDGQLYEQRSFFADGLGNCTNRGQRKVSRPRHNFCFDMRAGHQCGKGVAAAVGSLEQEHQKVH